MRNIYRVEAVGPFGQVLLADVMAHSHELAVSQAQAIRWLGAFEPPPMPLSPFAARLRRVSLLASGEVVWEAIDVPFSLCGAVA